MFSRFDFRARSGPSKTGYISRTANHPSARLFIHHLFSHGYRSEEIERRLLQRQNQLAWDIPASHPFALDGIKRNADRVRLLVSQYVNRLMLLENEGLYGGVEVFTPSLEDDNLWFSQSDEVITSAGKKYPSPRLLREQPFEDTWKDIEHMAYGIAWKLVRREFHLDPKRDLDDLVQAGRIAAWESIRTYDGVTAKYSTYAHQAMFYAMKDYSDSIRPTTVEYTPSEIGYSEDFADSVCNSLSILAALKSVKDAGLVVAKAMGFRDREIKQPNAAVRRHRARHKLAALFAA